MLTIKWTPDGWEDPQIGPMVPFQMHPAAKVCIIDIKKEYIDLSEILQAFHMALAKIQN